MARKQATPSSPDSPAPQRWLQEAAGNAMQYVQLALPMFSPTETTPAVPSGQTTPRTPRQSTPTVHTDGVVRQTLVNGEPVSYTFRRRRRKSIGFTIDQRGLIISAPRWVPLREVDDAVREKASWIRRKQREWVAFEQRLSRLDVCWEEGGLIRYLGRDVRIRLCGSQPTPTLGPATVAVFDDPVNEATDELWLPLPADSTSDNIRALCEGWLKHQAREILDQRMQHFVGILGTGPKAWHLSGAKTLWGSCNTDRIIRLNWRLINLPLDLIDYVVAHELAHLYEMNHSPAFWATVEKILPGYETAKAELHAMPEHLAV